jgi:hypothetical protein
MYYCNNFQFAGNISISQPSQHSGTSTIVAATAVSTASATNSADKPKKPSTDLSTTDSNSDPADLERSLVLDPELAEPAVIVISGNDGKSSLNTSHHLGSLSRALGTRDNSTCNHE